MAGDFLSALLNYNVTPVQGHNGIYAPPDPGMGEANNMGSPQDPVSALIALRASLSGGAPSLNIQRTTNVPAASSIGAAAAPVGSGVYDPYASVGLGSSFANPSIYQPPALAPLWPADPNAKTRTGRAN